MANKYRDNETNINDNVDDINQDVTQLADALEEVLKSIGNEAGEEVDNIRAKAEKLLKKARNKMNDHSCIHRAACDAIDCTNNWVREKPWYSIGAGAAIGLFIGALLGSRR